jgi:serine/threonine protein kinase
MAECDAPHKIIQLPNFGGTLEYAAPEMLWGWPHAVYETDVWAVAMVCYVVLVGYNPFTVNAGIPIGTKCSPEWTTVHEYHEKSFTPVTMGNYEMLRTIAKSYSCAVNKTTSGLARAGASQAAISFFTKALAMSPFDRPTAEECFNSEWLRGADADDDVNSFLS